jgi:hypothetical protein
MADKSLPNPDLPDSASGPTNDERRALLRRAAIGLPVILATVHGRTAWGRQITDSCAASMHASGCANR